MMKVNRADVKALELKAPGACTADRVSLYGQLRAGKILSAFTDQEREIIWTRILSASTDRLIPSLSSFFADVNYLQGPASCVKLLIELIPGETVSAGLERAFSDINQRTNECIIQQSASAFASIPGTLSDRLEFGCRHIWINAMREYREMPTRMEGDDLLAKPKSKLNAPILCEFASLAYRLGFESEKIRSLTRRSADEEIARGALLEARRPDRYKYDENAFAQFVEQMIAFFSTAEAVAEEDLIEFDSPQRAPKRSGIPETGYYKTDKSLLFLEKLHNANEEQCDEITSFFIRRSIYFAFFGKPDRGRRQQRQSEHEMQERLAREEQERERQEHERLGQERLEQERRERERVEHERVEQERREQERLEQERLQQARLQQARLQQERQEQERQEQERQE